MEECVGGLAIWGEHGRRVSCKGLDILRYSYHEEERCRFVVWYNEDDSRNGPIGPRILKVEDYRSDGVRALLSSHGRTTTRYRCRCSGSSSRNSGKMV